MIFNPSKCYTLRITKGKQPVIYPYHMEGQVLESVNNNPHLGVVVWLPSGGLFCGRLAGVMFCAFLGVLEVPVLAGLMLLHDG
jgi:hypothetical protein